MKYIADILGIEAIADHWDGSSKLPYYLIDRYEFKKAVLDGISCLIMKPKGELDTLSAIKKHILRVHETEQLPIVLELDGIVARRRKSLIEARIPFVAPDCHIYLPFLGVALSERYSSVQAPAEVLMPSSQLLLFYYLYKNEQELPAGETAHVFNISAMQISRAIKQLVALNLVSTRKDGVRILISSTDNRRDLFERAKPNLLNPVRKKIYVEYGELPTGLPLAGHSALSELTMLGGLGVETFAFFGKTRELTGSDILVDNTAQAEVEIWRYNPSLLSKVTGIVDALSLVASLLHDDDPRAQQSIDELLLKVWEAD
jgi:DNA-binding MarR family transcriptional regulator